MAFTDEGWTIWTRSGSEVQISKATHATNAAIQAELDAHSNPIAFLCGDEWDDIELVDTRGRDYIAWYGTPSNGRPKLNCKDGDSKTGLKLTPGDSDWGDYSIIGIEMDGRNTGDSADDWRDNDRDLLWVNINKDDDGSVNLLIEDCYLHHCDTQTRLIDNHSRDAGPPPQGDTIGSITGTMRRCLLQYADSRDSHAVNFYGEGLGDGFVIEQCSMDKAGYFNTRNEDRPGKSSERNANKREHNIYSQQFGRPLTVRECFLTNSAANAAQLRQGGTFNCNFLSRNGMTLYSQNQTTTAVDNVIADREDISTDELRGIGFQMYGGTLTASRNVFYRPRHSSKRQRVIEASGGTETIENNASFNWGVSSSEGGRGFFLAGETEKDGSDGNDAVSNNEDKAFNDSSWLEDDAAAVTARFSRGLGQWRPATDHPGTAINTVRTLAAANSNATLPTLHFGNNGATSVGNGGLSGSPSTSLPTANAGPDGAIQVGDGFTLNGYATDTGDQTITYAWSQVSGPTTPTIFFSDQPIAHVSTFSEGTYVFRLTATNEDMNSDTDDTSIVVSAADNVAPTVTTLASARLQLPITSFDLTSDASDSDGSVASYAWTQVAGPNTATLANQTTATLTVSNLVEGTYQFRCTVTDDDSATGTSDTFLEIVASSFSVSRGPRNRSRLRNGKR